MTWKQEAYIQLEEAEGGVLSLGQNNFKRLEPGCRRLRHYVETRGNGGSKNKPPTPETRDEK